MRRALLVLLIASSACRKEAEPPPPPPAPAPNPDAPVPVTEVEPNDFQRPQQIPPRAIVTGSIRPPRPKVADDDWYRTGAAGKTLSLAVTLEGDATLEVYDRDRNRIARTTEGFVPAVACVESCFVKVSGVRPVDYRLTVIASDPSPDAELEPNNRAVDATPLEPGKPKSGTLYARDDEDWYRLALSQVQPGQFLRVELKGVDKVRFELEVRALDDAALLATVRAVMAGDSIVLRDLSLALGERPAAAADGGTPSTDAGTADAGASPAAPDAGFAQPGLAGYYFVLKGRPGSNPRVPYTLSATLEAGPPDLEREPNDDPQHATPLMGTATGYVAPSGDQDWYRIHLDAPKVAHLELNGADRADLELQVLEPALMPGGKPRVIARANEGGPREPEILPSLGLPAGDTLVLVQAAPRQLDGKWLRDAEDAQNPYHLALTLKDDDGKTDREPNDDVEHAQRVTLPAAITGYIWPRKDVDVFAFHVDPGHEPVNVRLSAVRGVDLMLRLFELRDGRADVIGTADARHGEGEEQLLAVPLKEGDYAVEVSSPRGKDGSATQPYELRVQ